MENEGSRVCGFGDCFNFTIHHHQLIFSSFALNEWLSAHYRKGRPDGTNRVHPRRAATCRTRIESLTVNHGCDGRGDRPVGLDWFCHLFEELTSEKNYLDGCSCLWLGQLLHVGKRREAFLTSIVVALNCL